MPNPAISAPPRPGPSIRLALLVPTSTDIAALMRAGPTTSPIIMRRTGLSLAQATPLTKLPTARCQTSSRPAIANTASASEVASSAATTTISAVRRCIRSAASPIQAPNSPIGSSRSMVIMATMNAECVRS